VLTFSDRLVWSKHTNLIASANTVPEAQCRLTNPYRLGQSIRCEGLENATAIVATDVTGKIVFQQALQQANTFEINTPLTNGLYIVTFLDQQRNLLAKKKLVIQE
jgi:hypothetical protein